MVGEGNLVAAAENAELVMIIIALKVDALMILNLVVMRHHFKLLIAIFNFYQMISQDNPHQCFVQV